MADGALIAELAEIKTNVCWIKKALEKQCIQKLEEVDGRVDKLESFRDEHKWIYRMAGLAVTLTATFMMGRVLNLI